MNARLLFVWGFLQLLYSGLDVGVLHVEDFVKLVLDDGLKEATPHGFLAKLGKFLSPGPDADHRVENVVGAAGHGPFYSLLATGTLYQVNAVCACAVCVLRFPNSIDWLFSAYSSHCV